MKKSKQRRLFGCMTVLILSCALLIPTALANSDGVKSATATVNSQPAIESPWRYRPNKTQSKSIDALCAQYGWDLSDGKIKGAKDFNSIFKAPKAMFQSLKKVSTEAGLDYSEPAMIFTTTLYEKAASTPYKVTFYFGSNKQGEIVAAAVVPTKIRTSSIGPSVATPVSPLMTISSTAEQVKNAIENPAGSN